MNTRWLILGERERCGAGGHLASADVVVNEAMGAFDQVKRHVVWKHSIRRL